MTRLEDIERCARVVDEYLRAHPNAADTRAGIQAWWIGDFADEASPEVVQSALELLLVRGRVVRRTLPDGAEVYHGADDAGGKV